MIDDRVNDANVADQVARFYDEEAAEYDRKRYESPYGRRKDQFHRALILDLLDEAKTRSGKLLEIGVGTGRLICHLSDHGFRVTGVDISDNMLEKTRDRLANAGHTSVDLYRGYDELDAAENAFAGIYSVFVVNLMPSFEDFCRRAARLLNTDGILVFNVPNLTSLFFPIGLYVNARGKTVTRNSAGYRHSHWYSRSELSDTLRRAGFTIERISGQPPWCGLIGGCRPLTGAGAQSLLARSLFIKARLAGHAE
jgi:SAM-dependent methyltransferase